MKTNELMRTKAPIIFLLLEGKWTLVTVRFVVTNFKETFWSETNSLDLLLLDLLGAFRLLTA